MNLSKEKPSTVPKDNEVIITKDKEEVNEKEIKLNPKYSVSLNNIDNNTQTKLTSSITKNRLNITSKLYQNRTNSKTFLEAYWELNIPSLYFKFSFEEPKIVEEERTQVPICFLLKYTEKNYIDIYLQIKDKDTFPRQVKERDIILSNGLLLNGSQNKTKENEENNKNYINNSPPAFSGKSNDSVIDLTQEQEMCEEINGQYIPAQTTGIMNLSKQKEYSASIKIFMVGYCFGRYDIEFNSTETKGMRLMFTDLLMNTFKNEKTTISIITEITINKIYSNDQLQVNYSGLVNEGTTCYMNSLLQILYMLGYFKRSIFQVKISPHQYQTSKIYSMQKLFYDLMSSDNKPISTSHLIVSFGWSRDQMLIQHDVQEFFIILAEIMEKELKETKEEDTFKYLFEGKIMNHIKCIKVNFESKTEEKFTDLQLTIKNCNNIYDSFDKYTEEELLTGNDQYDTNSHGKQDAQKRIVFSSLPRVLILQLKRFEYNSKLNNIEKINDRFEFYDELSLKKYTVSDKEDMPSQYECHAVIVHVGLINNGHYYCYIQPEERGPWIKFNDEKVSIVEHYEVFNNNYGGNIIHYIHTNADTITKDFKMNFTNAYLLIYIRKDCLKDILVKLTIDEIPKEMINVFNLEKEEKERERMSLYRRINFVDIKILTKEIIESNINNRVTGLTDNINELNNTNAESSYCKRIKLNVHKDMQMNTLISLISQITHIPKHQIFVYRYTMERSSYLDRYNYQMKCLPDNLYQKTIADLGSLIESNYFLYIHTETNTPILCSNSTSIALGKDKEIRYALDNQDRLISPYSNDSSNTNIANLTSVMFYDPKENNWELKSNNVIDSSIQQSIDVDPIREKSVLVFVKSPIISIDLNSNLELKMKLEKVYQMRPKDTFNTINTKNYFKTIIGKNLKGEFKEKISSQYDNLEIQYLIEYSSLSNFKQKDSVVFLPNFILKCNQTFDVYDNDAICIVLSLKSNMESQTINDDDNNNGDNSSTNNDINNKSKEIVHNDLVISLKDFKSMRQFINNQSLIELTQANVDFVCSTNYSNININTALNIPSEKIALKSWKETLQKHIISLIKESLFSELFPYKAMSLTSDLNIKYQVFLNNEQHDLISFFTEANYKIIQLCPYKHNKLKNYYTIYPLLEYLSLLSNQIKFKINLDNLLNKLFFSFYKILICDQYSNPTICGFFERETSSPSVLFEIIIRNYIKHDDDINNYYFVPYNPVTLIAFNILPSWPESQIQYYTKQESNSEIRYQPFPKRQQSPNKVYVCVYKNKSTPLLLPFFIYCDINKTTIKEMKEMLLEIVVNNKEFSHYKDEVAKLKFYKCLLYNFKPTNMALLDLKMDNQPMSNNFSSKNVINICIDLSAKNNDDNTNSNNDNRSNVQNGNKNYLLID